MSSLTMIESPLMDAPQRDAHDQTDEPSVEHMQSTPVVVSAAGGEYEATEEQKKFLCLTENYDLYLSSSHTHELCVQEFCERLSSEEVSYRIHRVSLEKIQTLYAEHSKGHSQSKVVSLRGTDTSELQRSIMRIIRTAVGEKASDIHIVVKKDFTDIFYRVHGQLVARHQLDANEGIRLCSTIYQTMSDIAEPTFISTEPQDGRLGNNFSHQLGLFGGRIATRPTANGIQLVMRLLYQAGERPKSLINLGLLKSQEDDIKRMLQRREGINILSGPTGSGKSTTLAVILGMVAKMRPGDHILTIEDPCEYEIPGARQTPLQIDRSKDRDAEQAIASAWASGISNAMRLDPDTMMFGEIRDQASAKASYRGAMTGHMIWTTIHANDPFSVMERLKDLGVDDSLLTDPALTTGIISQRLVPTLCQHCKRPLTQHIKSIPLDLAQRLVKSCSQESFGQLAIRGAGCEHCHGTAVAGRTLIAETVVPNKALMDVFRDHGKAAARAYWLKHMGGVSRSSHLARVIERGIVDPMMGEQQICMLDEDSLLGEAI